MIIGLVALFGALFGGGSIDYFYIDKIGQGVNKEVVDKDRKEELKNELKAFTKTAKEFYKLQNKELKELREKNLDRGVDANFYLDFFDKRMEERIELQKTTIDVRLSLQEKITDDEWAAIMKGATDSETKEAEKTARKEMKKSDKNHFREQETAIVQNVADQDRRAILLKGLAVYEVVYDQIHESYESINVNDSQFLVNKSTTREEMVILANLVNEQRLTLYKGYSVFMITTEKNSTDEEYKAIMKAFNKLLK